MNKFNLKLSLLIVASTIILNSCTTNTNKKIETISTLESLNLGTEKLPGSGKIKSVFGRLYYLEFEINNINTKVDFNEYEKITKLTSYIEEKGQPIEYSTITIDRDSAQRIIGLSEIINFEEKPFIEILKFKYLSEKSIRSEDGKTDISFDSSGNIIEYIKYTNDDRTLPYYYYLSKRNSKGDEEEVILVYGELDSAVDKVKFEYLEFDKDNNWIKRKITKSFEYYELDEFEDHFNKKKTIESINFPVKHLGKLYEVIEERTIEYY